MKLKEWQHHIRQTHEERKHLSWCKQQLSIFEWAYTNIDHAAHSAPLDRIQPCPACVKAVAKALAGN